jgi:hypothetical protein
MVKKLPAAPATQRTFGSAWSELDYLCKKIHYWLYARKRKGKAAHYLHRLERVLRELPENDKAIIREDGLALLCELKGNLAGSRKHRRREIQLMEHLHDEARSPKYDDTTRAYMLRDRDMDTLEDRRAILEALTNAKPPRRDVRWNQGTSGIQ